MSSLKYKLHIELQSSTEYDCSAQFALFNSCDMSLRDGGVREGLVCIRKGLRRFEVGDGGSVQSRRITPSYAGVSVCVVLKVYRSGCCLFFCTPEHA